MLTHQQLILRRQGLGGSDMSALSGLSRRWRPIDVWRSKCEAAPPLSEDDPTEDEVAQGVDVERGIYLEPAVRHWYARRRKAYVEEPGTILHPSHRLVLATPDGLCHFANGDDDCALEIKCPRSNKAGDWFVEGGRREAKVPQYYVPQVLWEMAVLGVRQADVAAYLHDELYIIPMAFDDELYASLRHLGETFWDNCVVPHQAPPVDDSPSYNKYLCDIYPEVKHPELREATDDVVGWAKRLKVVIEGVEELKRERCQIENHIKDYIADAQGVKLPNGAKITWKETSPRAHLDHKSLIAHCKIDSTIVDKFTAHKQGARRFLPTLTNLEGITICDNMITWTRKANSGWASSRCNSPR